LPNGCHSTDWAGFGEKEASLAFKRQRRKKIGVAVLFFGVLTELRKGTK
jgi:hypothetical protein